MKDLTAIRELAVEALVRRFTSYFTSLNCETAEGTASHFPDATICLLASTSTVTMYDFERSKHWFEDDQQATIYKSNGEMVERTASHFRGASICLLASTAIVAMDGFTQRHTGPIRWDI